MDKKEYTKNTSALFLFMPIFFLLVIGIFVSLVQVQQQQQTQSRASTVSSHDCTVSSSQLDVTSQEEAVFNEINQFRQQNGETALTIVNPLNQAASWMSNDMMMHNSLNHTDSFGRDTATRLSDCGLQNAAVIGEIIDSGTTDPIAVMTTWERIPSQSTNLLNKNFTQVGVSLSAGDATHQPFWTVNFSGPGNPTPTPTPRPTQYPTSIPIPTPTYITTPTITPVVATPTPTPHIVFPKLLNLSPNPVNRNANVIVTGALASNANASFQLFLDNVPKGNMSCQSGTCQGFIFVSSSAAPGLHIVSVDGGSTLILNVSADASSGSGSGTGTGSGSGTGSGAVTPLPTGKFTPTNTPIPVTPLPTIDPSFVANPNDMQIFISVKIPGVGKDGNAMPKHLTRKVIVSIFGLDNQPVVTGTADLKYDGDLFRGIVHFGKVANGTYYLKVVSPGMLQEYILPEFQQLDTSKLNIAPDTLMIQGDLNADNAVTIDDYNIALVCFQNNKCGVTDGLTQNALDFNDDGLTNVADYNLLLQTFWHFLGD